MITEENKPYRRWPRTYGFILLAISVALGKWQIYDSLYAAENGKQRVIIVSSLLTLAVVGSICGALYLIFGSKVNQWCDKLNFNPHNIGWRAAILYTCLAMAILALYIFIIVSLGNQGYHREL